MALLAEGSPGGTIAQDDPAVLTALDARTGDPVASAAAAVIRRLLACVRDLEDEVAGGLVAYARELDADAVAHAESDTFARGVVEGMRRAEVALIYAAANRERLADRAALLDAVDAVCTTVPYHAFPLKYRSVAEAYSAGWADADQARRR